ncbi:hypothetical protein KDH02_004480, partial [Salmonella enterica]|nr:hypothetical protein [Salmonella enterica]
FIGGGVNYYNKNKLTATVEITPAIYSPFFYISCNDDVVCRNKTFQTLLSSYVGDGFIIKAVGKSNSIKLKKIFHKGECNKIENNLFSLRSKLKSWYTDDIESFFQESMNLDIENKKTETFSRMYFVATTTKRYLEHDNIIIMSKPKYTSLYDARLIFFLSGLLGLTCSFVYVLYRYINRYR